MMQKVLVGVLAGLVLTTATLVQAQAPQGQPPAGETSLGSVTLPKAVKANGERLAAGAYQLRLAAPQGAETTRWIEFVRAGKVAGREVATIIPQTEMKDLMTAPAEAGPRPAAGGTRVETLKGDDYVRVWVNRRGVNYLLHLPPA